MPNPPLLPYDETSDYSWTEIAFTSLTSGKLAGEVISRDGVVRSALRGPCPRCTDRLDDRQTHTAVTNLQPITRGPRPGGDASPENRPTYFAIDVTCNCESHHQDTPKGKTGCGVSFRVELKVRFDNSAETK